MRMRGWTLGLACLPAYLLGLAPLAGFAQDQRQDGSAQGKGEPSSEDDGDVHQDDSSIGGHHLFLRRGTTILLFPNEVVKK